jgi:hypothetical protein
MDAPEGFHWELRLERGRELRRVARAGSDGPVFVAIEEDDYGRGAAVAAACVLDDGRIEVDGWCCE